MKWIKCKEKLPPNDDYILFSDGDKITVGYYIKKVDVFYTCLPIRITKPTHWMPFPESPKKEFNIDEIPIK